MNLSKPRSSFLLGMSSVLCIFTFTFATPATATSNDGIGKKIGACVKNNNGKIRLANSSHLCHRNEYFVSWNKRGRKGPAGNDGADGATGPQGPAGNDGADGATGPQGPAGNDGADGVNGARGEKGEDGTNGIDGAQGPAGMDAPDRSLDICILYYALPELPAPDYCPSEPVGELEVGDIGPGGGIVFYITDGGSHGLEAAPQDQSVGSVWCDSTDDIAGIVNYLSDDYDYFSSHDENDEIVDPQSGSINTSAIIEACGESTAAGIASAYRGPDGTTTGWFLPNKHQLLKLGSFMTTPQGIEQFPSYEHYYWSSSEASADYAWALGIYNIGYGQLDQAPTSSKPNNAVKVRAIRAF